MPDLASAVLRHATNPSAQPILDPAIPLDQLVLRNIREFYDDRDLDLLGDSLAKEQQNPIHVGRLVDGKRTVFDGSRRVLAGRKKGLATLMGLIFDREPSPEELVQFQLVSDIHKKHLTPHERSMAAIGIEKANPGLTVKQLAAVLDMDESLFWRYLQAKKLGPEALAAYKAGDLPMTAMVDVSRLSHDEQPILLDLKGGRAEIARESKKRRSGATPSPQSPSSQRVKVPTPSGGTMVLSDYDWDMNTIVEELTGLLKDAKKGLDLNYDVKTWIAVRRDRAAASS